MRRMLLLGSILLAGGLLAVGGCTPVTSQPWSGTGSEAAFDTDAATCDTAALVKYPPMTMGVPGYFRTPDEFCSPTAGGTNCMIIGEGYLPQVQSSADTNTMPRSNAFHSCMVTKGWHPTYQAGGEVFTPPGGVAAGAVSQALTYCEDKFKGQRNTGADSARFHDCVVTRTRELGGPA
jgi:hypothetical protein